MQEARLIFMGVEHTQPERGRKLVIDIGGGSTESWSLAKILSPAWGKPPHGLRELLAGLFPGGVINKENFQRAPGGGAEAGDAGLAVPYSGWTVALGASGTIKAAQEVLVAMGEKDGFITPERLEMLVNELLKHKTSDALSLLGLRRPVKAVFAPGLAILCGCV
ncbi:hypothetical protein LNP74_19440 [Klebsiella pneumoniae subsp. pneumoniae]|nr:hypothetical protein [Klebsiella pneumoniae subsp. pneumoniae]